MQFFKAWAAAAAMATCLASSMAMAQNPAATVAPIAAASASVATLAAAPDSPLTLVQSGQYLATAADCAACHTAKGGRPFAGGYPVASPMGVIYSTNITPSTRGGIGDYSEADFARALREGVRRDGAHLYPAMPYTAYAALTDRDVHALYVYFHQSVAAVDAPAPQTALPFPFNIRASMALWNALYLNKQTFTPDTAKTDQVNRGAYLVNALEHCAACHTPRDTLMGQSEKNAFAGGSLGSWYAPNISSDPVSGIGAWSDSELRQYLRTGSVPGRAQAAGPMAEAIDHSLQHLNDQDIDAIVAYLKQTRPMADGERRARFDYGHPLDEADLRGNTATPSHGFQIFSGTCAACHQANGGGLANGDYPSLYHNTATGAANPDNLIAAILFGLRRDVNGKPVFMPGFGPSASFTEHLSDQDVADVANFVLTQYGNPAVQVSVADVSAVREGGAPVLLVRLGRLAVPGLILVLIVIGLLWRRGRAARQARAAR